MKRYMTLLALLLCTVLPLAGCSGNKNPEIDQAKAAETIREQVEFKDELLQATADNIGNYYAGLADLSDSYTVLISGTGVTVEEIAIVKAKEGKSAEDIKAELNKRIEDQKFRYENYMPAEMVKLNDPVIEAKGDTVIMILSDDSGTASKTARNILDGK